MAELGFLVVILLIWGIAKLAGSRATSLRTRLGFGTPARGILLWVSSQASGSVGTTVATKMQLRLASVDVEIPGRPPFEVTTTIAIPLNLVSDVVPGATVELRVAGADSSDITVVGPGIGIAQNQLPVTSTQGGAS